MTDDNDRALSDIRSDIEETRKRLADTLDAIEDRLDVPKRLRELLIETRDRVDALRQERPEVVYGVLASAAALVAATTALIIRAATRR